MMINLINSKELLVNLILMINSKRLSNVIYLAVTRQFACLVLNPITVYSYGFFFQCMTVGQASDLWRLWRKALIGGLVPDAFL